jgi:lipid-A-disaccharide synthase
MSAVLKLFIVAGEPSGDIHAANVVREILSRYKPSSDAQTPELSGTGGAALAALGQKQYANVSELTAIGFVDVIKKIPFLIKLAARMEAHIKQDAPDVILLMDYAGFNLRFAKRIKKYNIPVVLFAAPQVWIWHYSRVKTLAKYFDKVLCLLPFEEDLLRKEGVKAVYIGHPASDTLGYASPDRESFCGRFSLDPKKTVVALAPGSRPREIRYLMPVMISAAKTLEGEKPAEFILAKANSVPREAIQAYIPEGLNVKIVEGETPEIFKHADIIWICSGTATLEAGILGTPMIILYKAPLIDVLIIKLLTNLRTIGLPNIILGNMAAPEVLGKECTPENLLRVTAEVLEKSGEYRAMLAPLNELFASKTPLKNAAQEILELITK